MTVMHAQVGDSVRFSKTVGESEIYLFAGLTGDLSQNHTDDEGCVPGHGVGAVDKSPAGATVESIA